MTSPDATSAPDTAGTAPERQQDAEKNACETTYNRAQCAHKVGLILSSVVLLAGGSILCFWISQILANEPSTVDEKDSAALIGAFFSDGIPKDMDSAIAFNVALKAREVETETGLIKQKFKLVALTLFAGLMFGCMGFLLFLLGVVGNSHLAMQNGESKLQINDIAPGALILVFSMVLIGFSVTREYKMTSSWAFEHDGPREAVNNGGETPLTGTQTETTSKRTEEASAFSKISGQSTRSFSGERLRIQKFEERLTQFKNSLTPEDLSAIGSTENTRARLEHEATMAAIVLESLESVSSPPGSTNGSQIKVVRIYFDRLSQILSEPLFKANEVENGNSLDVDVKNGSQDDITERVTTMANKLDSLGTIPGLDDSQEAR